MLYLVLLKLKLVWLNEATVALNDGIVSHSISVTNILSTREKRKCV